jgi:predicted ATPase with chaperone activity
MQLEPQVVAGFYKDGLLDQVVYLPLTNVEESKRADAKVKFLKALINFKSGRTIVELDPANLPELGSQLAQ